MQRLKVRVYFLAAEPEIEDTAVLNEIALHCSNGCTEHRGAAAAFALARIGSCVNFDISSDLLIHLMESSVLLAFSSENWPF